MKVKKFLPNGLSILRLFIIPFILMALAQRHASLAMVLILFASLTDYLDGVLARIYKAETLFGKIIDPLADKVLIISLSVFFYCSGQISIWLLSLVILRDICILLASLFFYIKNYHFNIKATHLSKVNTVVFLFFLIILTLQWLFAIIPSYIISIMNMLVVGVTLLSWGHYFYVGIMIVRNNAKH